MLLRLNKAYIIIAALLYLIFCFSTTSKFLTLYTVHVCNFIAYIALLTFIFKKKKSFYSKSKLIMIIFLFSASFVSVYNYTSYLYNNNFFVFSESDALGYHYKALLLAHKSFKNSIHFLLASKSQEDLGAVLVISTIYRFIESNLAVNFFYVVFGIITAIGIQRICSHFMSNKYSFICSVTYSLSSYVLWFHSSSLKESFMCMLIVLFFDKYYFYEKSRNLTILIPAALYLLALLFFRPPLLFFSIAAVGLGTIMKRRKGVIGAFLVIIVLGAFAGLYPVFESDYNRFLMGGDFDRVLMSKQSMIKGSLQFTYSVNLLSQLIGPFPTISPDVKVMLSFFSPGLIYKALLSVFFWFGVYYIFKFKIDFLYPLVLFVFFEIISLLIILEGLELRKSLPHFPMIYIIAFWFMDKFDSKKYYNKFIIIRRVGAIFSLSAVLIFIAILSWNLRSNVL